MIIWCLFSVANEYNQPKNNLVSFWAKKPSFNTLLCAFGSSVEKANDDLLLGAAALIKGEEYKDGSLTCFRLVQITEGMRL